MDQRCQEMWLSAMIICPTEQTKKQKCQDGLLFRNPSVKIGDVEESYNTGIGVDRRR